MREERQSGLNGGAGLKVRGLLANKLSQEKILRFFSFLFEQRAKGVTIFLYSFFGFGNGGNKNEKAIFCSWVCDFSHSL
ncbi:MAG: hypothetical protein ACYSWR_00240 [Planctomycetota bacterium]|jgi:hypothetical protein